MSGPSRWSTHHLAEFLAAVSACGDEASALRRGIERAAEALEAPAGAVVVDGRVVASIGFPPGGAPEAELADAAVGRRRTVPIPGAGLRRAVSVPLGDERGARLLIACPRAGGLGAVELNLLRSMARVLTLTLRMLRTLEAERELRERSERQARENAELVTTLRARQLLLESLAGIQDAIARRAPLQDVLESICAGAYELLGDSVAGLLLRDEHDRDELVIAAAMGAGPALLDVVRRWRVGEGAGGRAVAEERLVAIHDCGRAAGAGSSSPEAQLQAAMAAPVREGGHVIGSLVVASYVRGRRYSAEDRETLQSFADHASLALTDARRVDEMLHHALHDALTGLPNRVLFTDRLNHAVARARRNRAGVAVMVLDLDRFKTINDSLGHVAGDGLLVAVADRLRECLRQPDTAARLGGDEFAILLENVSGAEEARLVAERITDSLRAPFSLSGREVFLSASAGIATALDHGEEMLRNADVAMYHAKSRGTGLHAVFEPGMRAGVLERLELEADLQRALHRDELRLRYQPIVDLRSGRVCGFEALVRWRHPTRGVVPPLAFIPLSEENGLIVPIGRWVLLQACRDVAGLLRRHPSAGPLSVNVNISGRQLEQEEFVEDVAAALRETGLPPGSLTLEITESVLMRDTEAMISRLRRIKDLGIRFAVDDFGTGYSSLQYLRRFPIDDLKMAKPFVDGIGHGAEYTALARAIIDLGAGFGLLTVAEGVETGEQLDALRELGCDRGQGFHFSRPLAAADAGALLGRRLAGEPLPAAV